MQLEFVLLLDAGLADMVGAFVVGGLVALLDYLHVALVDAADVADGVRGDRAERILAEQARLDLDTREQIAIGSKACDLLFGQARTNRQAFEGLAFLEQSTEALAVFRQDLDHPAQTVDRGIEVVDLRWRDLERESRIIARQDHPLAIDDDTPIGNDRHQRDPVVLGARRVVGVLNDLQVEEPGDQQGEGDEHGDTGESHPKAEAIKLAIRGSQW